MSKAWTVLCLPFADPEQRDLKEAAIICFVETDKEASLLCEGLPRRTYKGSSLRKIKTKHWRLRTEAGISS